MSLEDLIPGTSIDGLVPGFPVTLERIERSGDRAVTIYFRDEHGRIVSRMLFADDTAALRVHKASTVPTLDASATLFLEAFDTHRIREASLHDPLLAVNSASIEPLPHQLLAVYEEMLPRRPLRFLLADDPGAGKTIMAGLYLREILARRIARRCLIAVPGGLVEQWQQELQTRFGLHFTVFDRSHVEDGKNPFASQSLLIIRIDQVARDSKLLGQLRSTAWDLAVVDEAHKLSARFWGRELKRSKRFALGEVLGEISANFLLMSATPHSGKEDDFQVFMSLLDSDRFVGRAAHHDQEQHVADLMRRLVKEQLRHMDGRLLFPERRASTIHYTLRPEERRLYEGVSDYVRNEMNKVEGDESRRTVGFALLILQRRLASSPEAILQSLTRRRDRLKAEVDLAQESNEALARALRESVSLAMPEDDDDLTAAERENLDDALADGASASRSLTDLQAEILLLDQLVCLAQRVREARVDRKWEQLANLLTSPEMHDESANRRKIIIFTEHRDTLAYLEGRIVELLGGDQALVTIHGGTRWPRRREAQHEFSEDPTVSVLLATDAAGEGINLQCANLMVNYDLPWNPNRLEQRFGRIHRIGQTETCHLWNLVASDTREGDVFATLLDKLEKQRVALGDRVFDVLGDVLSGSDLKALLTAAIRSDDEAALHDKLEEVVESKLGHDMEERLAARAQSVSNLGDHQIDEARRKLAAARAVSLQPTIVERFVRRAAVETRCELHDEGASRLRVPRVSSGVRGWSENPGTNRVRSRYDHLTFDVASMHCPGQPPAELMAPGHPFVDALAAALEEESRKVLLRGTVLHDARSEAPYLLVLLQYGIRSVGFGEEVDAVTLEQRLSCLKVSPSGEVSAAAPQAFTALSTRGESSHEVPAVDETERAVDLALAHVKEQLVPTLKAEAVSRVENQRRAELLEARRRLEAEIRRLDSKAARLAQRSSDAHELQRVNERVEELERRRAERESEMREEVRLEATEPKLIALAAVVPGGEPGFEARLAQAKRAVARSLQIAGRVDDALPLSGYDFMFTPSDLGQAPRLVSVRIGVDDEEAVASDAEKLVASNVGDAYYIALADEQRTVRWRGDRNPVPTA